VDERLLDEVVLDRLRECEEYFAALVWREPDLALAECGWLNPARIHDQQIRQFWAEVISTKDSSTAALKSGLHEDLYRWSTRALDEPFGTRALTFAKRIQEESYLLDVSRRLPAMAVAVGQGDIEQIQRLSRENIDGLPLSEEKLPSAVDVGLQFIGNLEDERVTIPTHIIPLDNALGGLWRGTELVICSRPSIGKTALSWQIVRNIASNKQNVLFISLEMSSNNLWARAVCGAAGIPYRDVISNRLAPEDQERKVKQLFTENTKLIETYGDYLLIDDKTPKTSSEIWKLAAAHRPDVIIVDHIRLLADTTRESETKRLGVITWNLKQIAKEFNLAMVALAQLNRGLESRSDKRPTLADLRDSGEIEENGDIVIGLHREDVDLQVQKMPCEAIILKFRDGPSALRVHMEFDGLRQWFDAVDKTIMQKPVYRRLNREEDDHSDI
jgi:KaiC/GvpD/RAD55 family RecA-like ATPase